MCDGEYMCPEKPTLFIVWQFTENVWWAGCLLFLPRCIWSMQQYDQFVEESAGQVGSVLFALQHLQVGERVTGLSVMHEVNHLRQFLQLPGYNLKLEETVWVQACSPSNKWGKWEGWALLQCHDSGFQSVLEWVLRCPLWFRASHSL